MHRTILRACLGLTVTLCGAARHRAASPDIIPLAGQWRFCLDANKEGIAREFFQRDLPQRISLPGSTDEARLGRPNPNPPTLDGLYQPYVYEGPAWYQRDVEIPAAWHARQVSLFLERTHWTTRVWIDDRFIGTQDSLIAPHLYDLGTNLVPGKHRLTIMVDNTKKIDLGRFVSINYEGTQTNWNGLIGRLEMRAKDLVCMAGVEVYPDVTRKLAKVRITIRNLAGPPATGTLTLTAAARGQVGRTAARRVPFRASGSQTAVDIELSLGADARPWDEFSPFLYDLTAALSAHSSAGTFADKHTVTFGLRELSTRGTQLVLNGRPIFLRGTLECAIFPRTGYPPCDTESWRRIYRIIRSYGLNSMRFHSWTPPDAAFSAADLEGIIIQTEGPQANVQAGRDATRDAFLEQELLRIVRTYGNHASFGLMALGNEFGGPVDLLTRWVGMLIQQDPRHLYTSASNNQTMTPNRQFTVSSRPRGVRGPSTAFDFADVLAAADRPLIGHEIGQWTFYPNFDEIKKYTGVLAARNFELVRDDLAARHMLDLAPQFVQAAGKHAALLYKEEMELLLRTSGHAGYQLLDLHDYPGQGTALIGILDPFWDSKGFVRPETHRRYCGPTVPLLRIEKRTFTTEESLRAKVDIAHFGPRDLVKVQPQWTIRDERSRVIFSGSLPAAAIPAGKLSSLGEWTTSLAGVHAPAKLNVEVSLKGTAFANDWDIWVYPANAGAAAPAGVLVTRTWHDAKAALAGGNNVVLFPDAIAASMVLPGSFLPVFWSPIWFPNRQPATMSILCDPKHPAFAGFPTEFHTNWQWYDLLRSSRSVVLDKTPPGFRPIVQVVDNFSRNHKLGNLFEARVGRGKLLVCTMDPSGIMETQPAARQLLRSLYAYVGSRAFQPPEELEAPFLESLFAR